MSRPIQLHAQTKPTPPLTAALWLLMLAACCAISGSVAGQEAIRPAERLIDNNHLAEIGKLTQRPVRAESRPGGVISGCRMTCDAFVPRQPVLTVTWQNQAVGTTPTPSDADSRVRLDISGTPGGFNQGNFSTVRLSSIPQLEAPIVDPVSPQSIAGGEVLLNRVEDYRVIARNPILPIFDSPSVMSNSLPQLAPNVRAAVELDQRTGALGQVRVLGRASTALEGASQQIVTMVGLQPGVTYRLRLVAEQDDSTDELFQQICRIPVCPADFIDR